MIMHISVGSYAMISSTCCVIFVVASVVKCVLMLLQRCHRDVLYKS